MMKNYQIQILSAILVLILIEIPSVFAIDYDLNLVELRIVDLQILSVDDTPGYSADNSNLLKITVNATNVGEDYFLVSAKLFKILVMEPDLRKSTPEKPILEMVDNYYTSYDDELEVRYDNLPSRELFDECDYIHDSVSVGESKVFTICFDILKTWNHGSLNLNGSKEYYLVMMANHQSSTCPNCKKILLRSSEFNQQNLFPNWVQHLVQWHKQGFVSDKEYEESIKYLTTKGIITNVGEEINHKDSIATKNQQLKEHQTRLTSAQQTNLYVSTIKFYETNFQEGVFSGLDCKKQNGIVTLSGDYNNDSNFYQAVFFKLLLLDGSSHVVDSGIGKIVDVTPKDFRHFSVSIPHNEEINNCLVKIDSKFQK
jgi:hypothetical protein